MLVEVMIIPHEGEAVFDAVQAASFNPGFLRAAISTNAPIVSVSCQLHSIANPAFK